MGWRRDSRAMRARGVSRQMGWKTIVSAATRNVNSSVPVPDATSALRMKRISKFIGSKSTPSHQLLRPSLQRTARRTKLPLPQAKIPPKLHPQIRAKCMNLQQKNDPQRLGGAAAAMSIDEFHKFSRFFPERNEFYAMAMAEKANSASRQIYLSFKDEDVSNYFSTVGPVEDVRIPYQQKGMFGFVPLVHSETVKLIYNSQEMMLRRKLEEQAIELQGRRLINHKIAKSEEEETFESSALSAADDAPNLNFHPEMKAICSMVGSKEDNITCDASNMNNCHGSNAEHDLHDALVASQSKSSLENVSVVSSSSPSDRTSL